jgi:redox-sensitive bicupin YhaK (pirin superfamily)
MTARNIKTTIPALETSDGAGVRIKRSIGQSQSVRLDPFLMLDEFGSDQAEDYLAGFPAHPHRGFETVTYMIEGHMLHEDHLGNRGDLKNGGVQWMTAGRGIIHSEMPQQEQGAMRGFQLWLNLPGKDKMMPAAYRDVQPDDIPDIAVAAGSVKLIAGHLELEGQSYTGAESGGFTRPLYADIHLKPGMALAVPVAAGLAGLVYLYQGTASLGGAALSSSAASVLTDGSFVDLEAGPDGARLLLIAGKPIGEPIVQYGPFVMTSREEIEQAMQDYRAGTLTA